MKLKLEVQDIPLQQVNNFCMEYGLELNTKDFSIDLVEWVYKPTIKFKY